MDGNWENKKKRKKSSMKRKRKNLDETHTLFPLMLAAISNEYPSSELLLKQCLSRLHASLLFNGCPATALVLSLLPFLLNSKCPDIAAKSAEVIGAAALFSFDTNERIALDGEILKSLIFAVVSWKKNKSVSLAACNAVLDLSTTSIGRQRLVQFSALESFICRFNQVPRSSTKLIALSTDGMSSEICPKIGFMEDEFVVSLLNAVISLINDCTIEALEKIPRKLSETLLVYMKNLWAEVHKQMLGTITEFSLGRHWCLSNIRTNNLAESIFRLSLDANKPSISPFEDVKRSIFSLDVISFENFILNYWEATPLLIRKPSNASTKQDDIFCSFVQSLRTYEEVPSLIPSMLQNFVSCPPIASDELDVLNFLSEVKNHLGCPIVYQQDIRVLKTQRLQREIHFFDFKSFCGQAHPSLSINDILSCEKAYNEGYTVALRGLEFRFESISAIIDGLASLFGQPSAGANIYLTPPSSQGLARHCDDHCVLVCQLIGAKRWKIFTHSGLVLPRLYEHVDNLGDFDSGSQAMTGCMQFLLTEGDVLYIPRGFFHEACTFSDDDTSNGTTGFSLHLTLAIEVEPPFEWEGFFHLALYDWAQEQNFLLYTGDCLSKDLHTLSVNLMHVGIKLIGGLDPTFRKACLVNAISLMEVTESWLDANQRMIFRHLIDKIRTESMYADIFKSVQKAIQRNEDLFERIKWLQYFQDERALTKGQYWDYPLIGPQKFLILFDQFKDKAEAAFMEIKSKFCREVAFDSVEQRYKFLFNMYKKGRKQYRNGMLALHST